MGMSKLIDRYCHNDHIRQFRQAPHKHPHPPGGFIPEVDSRYESYVLGRATRSPSTVPKDKSDKQLKSKRKGGSQSDSGHKTGGSGKGTSIDRLDKDHAVSYGLQPSSRYLVQHWQDGTKCDMNGKPREIEVQIHCSMTTTDSIYLIKETSICNYIMIIHSPHLCGLPGFRADHSDVEMAKVRCREVISDDDFEKWMKGEEVVMPFLTIGKGLEPVMGEGDKSINQEEGKYEEMQMEEGVTINGLKDALNQLLGSDGIKGDNQGDEGEVMLITLEEDGDEPIVLQADIIGGEGEGGDGMDRETIMKLVKEYLRKKDKPKRKATVDGDGNGDEDSKNDEDIHKVREEL
jgi:protein OS-9